MDNILYLNTTGAIDTGWSSPFTSHLQQLLSLVFGPANKEMALELLMSPTYSPPAGVSKVGSYTGTGTTLSIDCGFTAGARFILIKRTDSTGDWYVWDTARGIIAGNDPYLLLNSQQPKSPTPTTSTR
jgi:hypothetical protein